MGVLFAILVILIVLPYINTSESAPDYLQHSTPIKVIEGVDHPSNSAQQPIEPPHSPLGPSALSPFFGSCFTLQKENLEYQLCPFYNITQKRILASTPLKLGTWGGKYFNTNHGSLVQLYGNGDTPCPTTTDIQTPSLLYTARAEYTCHDSSNKVTISNFGIASELSADLVVQHAGLTGIHTSDNGCDISLIMHTSLPCVLLETGLVEDDTALPTPIPPTSTSTSTSLLTHTPSPHHTPTPTSATANITSLAEALQVIAELQTKVNSLQAQLG